MKIDHKHCLGLCLGLWLSIGPVDGLVRPALADRVDLPSSPTASASASRSRRTGHGSAWPSGASALALVLALAGGAAVVVRRFGPRSAPSPVRVVAKVGLSPRHSVYVLRAGSRALLIGAGPQGPPALLAELDGLMDDDLAARPKEAQ